MKVRVPPVDLAALAPAREGSRKDGHGRGQGSYRSDLEMAVPHCGCCGTPVLVSAAGVTWKCACHKVTGTCPICSWKACHCRCPKREA